MENMSQREYLRELKDLHTYISVLYSKRIKRFLVVFLNLLANKSSKNFRGKLSTFSLKLSISFKLLNPDFLFNSYLQITHLPIL